MLKHEYPQNLTKTYIALKSLIKISKMYKICCKFAVKSIKEEYPSKTVWTFNWSVGETDIINFVHTDVVLAGGLCTTGSFPMHRLGPFCRQEYCELLVLY